jgi:hypothetical protein
MSVAATVAASIAFIEALKPFIPLALWGIKEAKDALDWGLETLRKQNADGREPTQEEWDKLNEITASLRKRLHSDDF